MEIGVVISIVLSGVTTVGCIVTGYYAYKTKSAVGQARLEERVQALEENKKKYEIIQDQVTRLEGRYEVFWKVIEPHLARIIHSPQHQRRDELIDKMLVREITQGEMNELFELLQDCAKDCKTDGIKLAAAMMAARVDDIRTRGVP
jgi:hypothetical protein